MSEKKKVKINGFVFTDEAEAEQAKKEAHGIHYVEERADMHHPETVLEIYNKMVKQELFETAVGFTYLKELQVIRPLLLPAAAAQQKSDRYSYWNEADQY